MTKAGGGKAATGIPAHGGQQQDAKAHASPPTQSNQHQDASLQKPTDAPATTSHTPTPNEEDDGTDDTKAVEDGTKAVTVTGARTAPQPTQQQPDTPPVIENAQPDSAEKPSTQQTQPYEPTRQQGTKRNVTWGADWWQPEQQQRDQQPTDEERDEENPWTSTKPTPDSQQQQDRPETEGDAQEEDAECPGTTNQDDGDPNQADASPGQLPAPIAVTPSTADGGRPASGVPTKLAEVANGQRAQRQEEQPLVSDDRKTEPHTGANQKGIIAVPPHHHHTTAERRDAAAKRSRKQFRRQGKKQCHTCRPPLPTSRSTAQQPQPHRRIGEASNPGPSQDRLPAAQIRES